MKISIKEIIIKLCLLSIFILPLNFQSIAQVNLDSLKQIWINTLESDSLRFKAINKYYKSNTFAQPDTVLILTDYHYNLAKERNVKKEMANALNEKSYAYYLKGDSKKSMESLLQSIALLEQLDNPIGLASVYSNIGNIYGGQNKYQEAVRYFNLTLDIFRKEGVEIGEARMLNNLGLIYYYIDNFDLALDHLTKALKLYERLKPKDVGGTLRNIGSVYYQQEEYDLAIENGEKALTILLENNNKYSAADCYFLLAKSYKELNQKDKALALVDKSLEIDYTIKNNSRIIERQTFIAEIAFDTNVNIATNKAEEILKLVKDDTQNELKANLYNLLYKCYKAQNKYNRSLEMHEKYVTYNDSVQIEKDDNLIMKEAIQNEFELKLQKTQLENETAQAQLKLNQLRKTYSILLAVALVIFLIIFYARSNILAQRKQREVLLKEIEQLKNSVTSSADLPSNKFQLDRTKIEISINRKINETDWKVLNILLGDPVISNKDIAKAAFLTVDGIGSCLRRMYSAFDLKESKYKKISLIMKAIKISNE
ncbi:MAG: tetratricopeptide repeat protein [Saprospiraceae bacterium]